MSELPIRGLEQTIGMLSRFPKDLQKNAVRRGMTAAASVVRDEARYRAPRKTGELAKSIKSSSARKNFDGTFSIKVRVEDFRGVFFEYGVSPHYITAGDATRSDGKPMSPRLLTRAAGDGGSSSVDEQALVINGSFVRGAVLHPGFAPKPFLRPALDIKSDEAVRALAFAIEEFVFNYSGFQASA